MLIYSDATTLILSVRQQRRTRKGNDVRHLAAEDVICYLREQQITLTYNPAAGTLHAGTGQAARTITL
jgi:hypothetical protein